MPDDDALAVLLHDHLSVGPARSATVASSIHQGMGDLQPALSAIDLSAGQRFAPPLQLVKLPKLAPITPIVAANEPTGPTLAPPNDPRYAMRPGTPVPAEPGFDPVWRSPSGDDLSSAFSEADKIAQQEQPAATAPKPQAKVERNDAPAPPAEIANAPVETSKQLKPVTETPQLASVPREQEQPAATSPPVDTAPRTTQAPSSSSELADAPRTQVAPPPVAAPRQLKPLTRNEIALRNKIRSVLAHYYRRPLNSGEHDAWEVMHGMLVYGLHSKVRQGSNRGEPITAIGWLCYNNPCKGKQLMEINSDGELRAKWGVGVQGHFGQFLAMLAQCNVTRTYPIRVDDREFTIEDLIVSEQKTCYPDTELTFKLLALMHYLPSDATWLNDRGEQWSIERLITEEIKAPIRGAACGGTHRLAGLSLAARKRAARGEAVTGEWLRAQQYTLQHENYAFKLQNPDGSFSTQWFKGPGDEEDLDRRVRTTGHILEWMLYQVDDEKLDYWRTVRAVNYLTNILYNNADRRWETGPLCHALHALVLYDERKFQPYDGDVPAIAARTAIPAQSASPTRAPNEDPDDRDSGFRLFGRKF